MAIILLKGERLLGYTTNRTGGKFYLNACIDFFF